MEGAFLRFGCVTAEVLIDNAKALVEHHDAVAREVRFNARLQAFARYWGFTPRISHLDRRTREIADQREHVHRRWLPSSQELDTQPAVATASA
ncbi:Integrase catalytic region (fragment) [Mesorhizobium sp. ORS 3324]